MYNVFPKLKKQLFLPGSLKIDKRIVFLTSKMSNVYTELKDMGFSFGDETNSNFLFLEKKSLPSQHYEIDVTLTNVVIYASGEEGFYYATKTLKQMINPEMECVHIEDGPDLLIRGFMYDISRNKVPKLETLKEIVDIMSDLKMNHLELYVEGFSFEYQSFSKYLEEESYITIKEYQELENYANAHLVDLVPNQNGFGHMSEWLAKEEFNSLAELPEGMFLWGTHRNPSTLNPLNEGSVALVHKMYDDMLPYSNSKYFNMNFDEPFELGRGKSKEECEKKGKGQVFLEYVKKAKIGIDKYHKQPLIWGDVLIHHDEVLKDMPKDIIFVDWGYDAQYPFNKNLKKLKDNDIQFMAAPATTSWCSLLGRTYDWVENIYNAVWNVYNLGGIGVLLTDWGDIGHLQHLPASFAPLVFCGLLSYRCESGTFKYLKEYLNKYIFKDSKNIMADVVIDAGTYYKYDPHYTDNGSVTFYSFVWALNAMKEENPIEYFYNRMKYNIYNPTQYDLLNRFLENKKYEINLCDCRELLKQEFINSINILQMISKFNFAYNETLSVKQRVDLLQNSLKDIKKVKKELANIWIVRNKKSGLEKTLNNFEIVEKFIKESIKKFEGGQNEKN